MPPRVEYKRGDVVNKENNIRFISDLPSQKGKNRRAFFLFDCGRTGEGFIDSIKSGKTKSYGGLREQLLPGFVRAYNGELTRVDLEDWDMLCEFNWYCDKNGYAVSHKGGKMHRMILNAPSHLDVDHINGDTYDNRKDNLRLATRSQNSCNTGIASNNTSGEKCVYWVESRQKFNSYINHGGKRYNLGYYDCLLGATIVVNNKRRELHKEFANHGAF